MRPQLQGFRNVCDGGHIYRLRDLTPQTLASALGGNAKAVLVVGDEQSSALRVLRNLKTKKGRIFGAGSNWDGLGQPLKAKRIGRWSDTASLWMVRQDGRRI